MDAREGHRPQTSAQPIGLLTTQPGKTAVRAMTAGRILFAVADEVKLRMSHRRAPPNFVRAVQFGAAEHLPVPQVVRSKAATPVLGMRLTNQAAMSSKSRVRRAPGRAHGIHSLRTCPQPRQSTRRNSASISTR
jgi:hypothetical protein